LLQVALNSDSTKKSESKFFEIANVYHPQENQLPQEALTLTLLLNTSLVELKTNLTELLQTFYLKLPSVTQVEGQIAYFGNLITISSVRPGWLAATIDVASFVKEVKTHPTYQPIPRYPAIIEDLTFTVPEKIGLG